MRTTGKSFPPMNATALIRSAWPRNAAKEIEHQIGCSRRQAWRMIQTGHIPASMRTRLIRALEYALERQHEHVGEMRRALRVREIAGVAPEDSDRGRVVDGADDEAADRSSTGPVSAVVKR